MLSKVLQFNMFFKKILPNFVYNYYKLKKQELTKKKLNEFPKYSKDHFLEFLISNFNINEGDTLLIHSSTDKLNIDFSITELLEILLIAVGKNGNLVFPTYPQLPSHQFLLSGEVWNVKRSLSYTGMLSEVARRYKGSIRSIHPTKSVCAIGPDSHFLTSTHQNSPYPYDYCSPYYKVMELNGKSIGIGVTSNYLYSTHIVDAYFKENFPVEPYIKELFNAKCINYNNDT